MSIEHARSSPFYESPQKNKEIKHSNKDSSNHGICKDSIHDSVFYASSHGVEDEIPNFITDLCKDLSTMILSKPKTSPLLTSDNLTEVIAELNDLRELIQHIIPYPLYAEVCRLLAVLTLTKPADFQTDQMLLCSYLFSEAFSNTLRNVHIANIIYFQEPEFAKEKNFLQEMLRKPICDVNLYVESFLQLLPKNWTVVQVSAYHSEEYILTLNKIPCPTKLVICQYRQNSMPLILSSESFTDEKLYSSFLTEFDDILQESSLTMLNKDSKLWWNTRLSLDSKLKELTKCMENVWLGCWKGLFLGIPQNEIREKQIQSAVDAICDSIPCANKNILRIIIDSAQYLCMEQISAAVCYLWNCLPEDEIHKKLCKSLRDISIALSSTERGHVILILDQSIQALPWECMPILNGISVSRMPSLSLLYTKLSMLNSKSILTTGIDTSNTYYVLNPGGDLTNSQVFFQERFENQKKWNGISGVPPNAKQYVSAFKDHDLFIYCGHGSGRQYFENVSVDKLKLQSTSILMGCSSGRLKRLGRILEPYGIVLKLLLSGCPSIIANLWDVTDRDIDRFTERLLQNLIPNYDEVQSNLQNIAKAASVARNACRLRYLVGAAPVVYGFPVYAKEQ